MRAAVRAVADNDRPTDRRWSDARVCSVGATAVAAFIVYGSLLPFDLGRPDTINPVILLGRIGSPWPLGSRADLFVNFATAVPFGFFLTGALRSGRRRLGVAAATLVVVAVSAVLGTAVEAVQVFSATRKSEWHDALGQMIGAALGVAAWTVAGSSLIRHLQAQARESNRSRFAARLLQLFFLPVYVFIQLTPLLPTDLAETYRERSLSFPLSFHFELTYALFRNLSANVLMNIPIGGLAVLGWVRPGTHRRAGPALLLGMSIMAGVEITQGFLWSRYSGMWDLLAGALGVSIGIASAIAWSGRRGTHDGDRLRQIHLNPWLLVAASAWTLVLVVQNWYPFDFRFSAGFIADRYFVVQLIPFKGYYPGYASIPLIGLHELVGRCLAGVPLGLLLRLSWTRYSVRRAGVNGAVRTCLVAASVFAAIELGQVFLHIPHEFPDVTDVILGVTGAAIGSVVGAAVQRGRGPIGGAPQEHAVTVSTEQRVLPDTTRAGKGVSVP